MCTSHSKTSRHTFGRFAELESLPWAGARRRMRKDRMRKMARRFEVSDSGGNPGIALFVSRQIKGTIYE